ncbi:MAG: type II toxin-antitoxin system Phd/YefM family antitoxin [Cytophagales bacterium]|nr:type II toxin-antitoxin system Phd/YefM family antitoxin [Cytophagales bacterium]
MISIDFSKFAENLKTYLDSVEKKQQTIFIKRNSGKGAVMMSLEEYNSMVETLHLLSSKKNADRLYESMDQVKAGKIDTLGWTSKY